MLFVISPVQTESEQNHQKLAEIIDFNLDKAATKREG